MGVLMQESTADWYSVVLGVGDGFIQERRRPTLAGGGYQPIGNVDGSLLLPACHATSCFSSAMAPCLATSQLHTETSADREPE